MEEYQRRLTDVLSLKLRRRSPSPSPSSLASASYNEKDGIGDEEFGVMTPASPTSSIRTPNKRSSINPLLSRLRSHGRFDPVSSLPRHVRQASNFSQISMSRTASSTSIRVADRDPAFILNPLRRLSAQLSVEAPTVMDVNGMIAIGTASGRTVVFSFNQDVRHVLGTETSPVTAVCISPDQTYVGVGHADGSIKLYDLSSPKTPARSTVGLTLDQVRGGRREGHLSTSRILHIGFVGVRHTSIVSGDEHGRAFWWSLGRVMGVDSNDVVRMLGTYEARRPSTLFAVRPLSPGGHSSDTFDLCALMTPSKLIVVGMKPSAKTWFRRMRDVEGNGCAVWLKAGELEPASDPVLAYSWGTSLHFLRVKSGENPSFIDGQRWNAPEEIQSLLWFDANHLLVTTSTLNLLDVRTMTLLETTHFDYRLVSYPSLRGPIIGSSLDVYRGKLFMLTASSVLVGTLQQWNDRILARVHQGDFLGSIHLAIEYFESRAPGNRIGLPNDVQLARPVIATKIRELIRSSLAWAFSEERMRDDTHFSADGRGVDLTLLFESLASACIDACLAIDDTDLLFDAAYEHYAAAGIQGIFLRRLEPFIFEDRIPQLPPEVVKALIELHADASEWSLAEAVIWHVEPMCLDINQAISICEEHQLWDALVYVYTRALRDYVTPMKKLEPSKLFPFIEFTLCGASYPSGEAIPQGEAVAARISAYEWIAANLLHLLHIDTEAFLHTLDIAFEDPFLDDSTSITRQTLVNQMLDVMSHMEFDASEITLLHIFVARNLPKYPQFLLLPPSTLHRILISLCNDPDSESREDRQLAAEFLLSAFTPHDGDAMLSLYEEAGFTRILASIYRKEQKWGPLIATLGKEPTTQSFEELKGLVARNPSAVAKVIPRLLESSIASTAELLQRTPALHAVAMKQLPPLKRLSYLSSLDKMDTALRHEYVRLLATHQTASVIGYLDQQGAKAFDLDQLEADFEAAGFSEGRVWALDRADRPKHALQVVETVIRDEAVTLGQAAIDDDEGSLHIVLQTITSICRMGTRICQERFATEEVEDMWFGMLHQLVDLVHSISALFPTSDGSNNVALESVRQLVQETLSSLVSSHAPAVSFPRLFKRLVDATPSSKRSYSEFRSILGGMLASHKAEGEMLLMTTRLMQSDLFLQVDELTRRRQQGRRPVDGVCQRCGRGIANEHIVFNGSEALHAGCSGDSIPS